MNLIVIHICLTFGRVVVAELSFWRTAPPHFNVISATRWQQLSNVFGKRFLFLINGSANKRAEMQRNENGGTRDCLTNKADRFRLEKWVGWWVSEWDRELVRFNHCEKLVAEAVDRSGTQRRGNVRRWKPLPSNWSEGVTVDTSVCATVNCKV
jgi:hypothetical protein